VKTPRFVDFCFGAETTSFANLETSGREINVEKRNGEQWEK
jgi:hypothetical protein